MRPLPSEKLDSRIIRVWRISALINIVIWYGIALLSLGIPWALAHYVYAADMRGARPFLDIGMIVLLVAIVASTIAFVLVLPKIRHMRWRYQVYPEEIDILRGIIWRTRLIIPLIRVQNVDTRQGPVMRMCNLASVTVSTAAGEHEIPGLDVQAADKLRDDVAVLARVAQEDV
jgi:membrane protein YdbS with pleckstrin-like domain